MLLVKQVALATVHEAFKAPGHAPAASGPADGGQQHETMAGQQDASPLIFNQGVIFLRDFTMQKPYGFVGKPDLLQAEEWLTKVKKIMNALHIHEDEDRVSHASCLFGSEAE